jgi:hypothetical protein
MTFLAALVACALIPLGLVELAAALHVPIGLGWAFLVGAINLALCALVIRRLRV